MNIEIAVSLIGFAGVCVGAIFGYMGKSRKHAAQDAKREQEQRDLFKQLFKALEEVKSVWMNTIIMPKNLVKLNWTLQESKKILNISGRI